MVLPRAIVSLFAAGVLAIGALGASASGSGAGVRRLSPAAGPGTILSASSGPSESESLPTVQIPSYLLAANRLWKSTHDSRKVREMLTIALEEVAANNLHLGGAPGESAASDGTRPAEVLRDTSTVSVAAGLIPVVDSPPALVSRVFHLAVPTLIALRSHESHARYSDWRKQWGAWHANLVKIPRPFDDIAVSAIKISIETWQ